MLLFMGKGEQHSARFWPVTCVIYASLRVKSGFAQNRVNNAAHQRAKEAEQIHRPSSETGPDRTLPSLIAA